jgi:acetoin utilization protein AcuC
MLRPYTDETTSKLVGYLTEIALGSTAFGIDSGEMKTCAEICVYLGEGLARYNFGEDHPFGPRRHAAFKEAFEAAGLDRHATLCVPVMAQAEAIRRFHTYAYVARVRAQSRTGTGFLDYGDTPAFKGVYEAAATVVGTLLDAVERIMAGDCLRAFVPIAGLHHARRDCAAGFCVFNDCGVAIETLLSRHGVARLAYVDIDAHHGDGVFYGFEDRPEVIFADLHQDGRTLYPGTGFAEETGSGDARGTKLNIPMRPGADERDFLAAWERVERHLERFPPEFILFQCGVDSLAGDPITGLGYIPASHAHATRRLMVLARRHCQGRLLAMGGGGYNLDNIAAGWTAVVGEMCSGDAP